MVRRSVCGAQYNSAGPFSAGNRPGTDIPIITRVSISEPADADLNGNVFVWVLIDQEDADDTAEGRILFTIPIPEGQERIRVEAETGESKRVQ